MKRFAWVAVAAMMAVLLTACGKPEPKKIETAPQSTTEQAQPAATEQQAAPTEQPVAPESTGTENQQ